MSKQKLKNTIRYPINTGVCKLYSLKGGIFNFQGGGIYWVFYGNHIFLRGNPAGNDNFFFSLKRSCHIFKLPDSAPWWNVVKCTKSVSYQKKGG